MQRDPITRNNVTVSGNLNAPQTLLFAHGMGTDQTVWKQITPAFEADYRWVSFDNVGAVESNQDDFRSRSFHYLNINGYASDLLEVCSALNLSGNTIFIGHSMGAMAGLMAATQRPGQFKALVLLGMSPCYQNMDGYQGGFTHDDIDKTYEALSSDYPAWTKALTAAAMANPDQPHLAEHFAQTMVKVPKELMLTVLCSILQMDHRSHLSKVAVPVLLIQSQNDIFVPLGVAHYLQASITGCQLKVIDAMGHLPHVSAPDKVVEAIKGFLSSHR